MSLSSGEGPKPKIIENDQSSNPPTPQPPRLTRKTVLAGGLGALAGAIGGALFSRPAQLPRQPEPPKSQTAEPPKPEKAWRPRFADPEHSILLASGVDRLRPRSTTPLPATAEAHKYPHPENLPLSKITASEIVLEKGKRLIAVSIPEDLILGAGNTTDIKMFLRKNQQSALPQANFLSLAAEENIHMSMFMSIQDGQHAENPDGNITFYLNEGALDYTALQRAPHANVLEVNPAFIPGDRYMLVLVFNQAIGPIKKTPDGFLETIGDPNNPTLTIDFARKTQPPGVKTTVI